MGPRFLTGGNEGEESEHYSCRFWLKPYIFVLLQCVSLVGGCNRMVPHAVPALVISITVPRIQVADVSLS